MPRTIKTTIKVDSKSTSVDIYGHNYQRIVKIVDDINAKKCEGETKEKYQRFINQLLKIALDWYECTVWMESMKAKLFYSEVEHDD